MSHNIFLNQNQPRTYIVKVNEAGQRLDYTLRMLFPNMGLRGRKRLWQYYKIRVNNKELAPIYKVKAYDSISITPLENCTQMDSYLSVQNPQNNFIYAINIAPNKKFNILKKRDYQSKQKLYTIINTLKILYFFKNDEVQIIHEHENYIFLYKPSGLHTVSLSGSTNSSLESEILHLLPNANEIILINRLDKETSGIVIATYKSNIPKINAWHTLENIGHCTKYYLALVDGHIDEEIIIKNDLDINDRKKTLVLQRASENIVRHTIVKPLAHMKLSANHSLSLVGCSIKKGARHQIRAHLAYAGYPLWGDLKYGGSEHFSFILHHCVLNFGQTKIICLPHWLNKLNTHMQNEIRHWIDNIV